jgi:tetratricopeptide (TPR) repeat protein
MLSAWIQAKPEESMRRLAVMDRPSIWTKNGVEAVPRRVLHVGAPAFGFEESQAHLEDHRAYWKNLPPLPRAATNAPAYMLYIEQLIDRQHSLCANNLGMLFDELNRTNLAVNAYGAALAFSRRNVSAMINLARLLGSSEPERQHELGREIQSIMSRCGSPERFALRMQADGFVRDPLRVYRRFTQFLSGGRLEAAQRQLELADAMNLDTQAMKDLLGRTYLGKGDLEAGEEIFRDMMETSPGNSSALLGMLSIHMSRGDFDEAMRLVTHARSLKEEEQGVLEAYVRSQSGDVPKAIACLERVLEHKEDSIQALEMLAVLALQARDTERLKRSAEALRSIPQKTEGRQMLLAQLNFAQGRFKQAYDDLYRIVEVINPRNIQALEFMVRLDVMRNQMDTAGKRSEDLLRYDPGNAMAQYALGCIHTQQGKLESGERYFRALADRQKDPIILNNLAWVLYLQEAYEEALLFAEQALKAAPSSKAIQDTHQKIIEARAGGKQKPLTPGNPGSS